MPTLILKSKLPELIVAFFIAILYQFNPMVIIGMIVIIALHELWHYLACRHYKIEVADFYVGLQGGYVEMKNTQRTFGLHSPPDHALGMISLAGPLLGTLSAGMLFVVLFVFTENDLFILLIQLTIFNNLLQLIPVIPCDGGWALENNYQRRPIQYLVVVQLLAATSSFTLGVTLMVNTALPGWITTLICVLLWGFIAFTGRNQWQWMEAKERTRRKGFSYQKNDETVVILYLGGVALLCILIGLIGMPEPGGIEWLMRYLEII